MAVVYETIRVKDGSVPLLDRHTARLLANCVATGLEEPAGLRQRILAARKGEARNTRLRVVWDGNQLDISSFALAATTPMNVYTARVRHTGYKVKTTDRAVFDQAREEARAVGADEALLLTNEGFVAEGTLFAVGWIDDGVLRLPSLELGILPSIGRARVLEVAGELEISVELGFYQRSALDGRSVFATTATRGVVKLGTLDGVSVPNDERLDQLAANFWPRG